MSDIEEIEEETFPEGDGDSLRDSLSAQFDEAGIEDEPPSEPADSSAVQPEGEQKEVVAPAQAETSAVTEEGVPEVKDTALKAPVNWSATEREQWSKIPPDVQERINEREKDMATAMADTAQARETQGRINQLGTSYASVLASEGVSDPVQAAEGLFQTVSQLRLGSPQQKAQQIAQLIEHYGVDIQQLDNQLVNTPQAQQNNELERMVQQRMQPYEQHMQQLAQQQDAQKQQARTQADNQVAQFAQKNEFLNDVREPMAQMIDSAAARGDNLDLQKAYDMACAIDPKIAQVVADRKAQEDIIGQKATLQAKQAAASTLNGRIGAVASGNGAMSMREQIASAWDNASDS